MSAQPDLDTLGTTRVVPFFRPKIFEKPGGFSGADFLIIHKSLVETDNRSDVGFNKILRMKRCPASPGAPDFVCHSFRRSENLPDDRSDVRLNKILRMKRCPVSTGAPAYSRWHSFRRSENLLHSHAPYGSRH